MKRQADTRKLFWSLLGTLVLYLVLGGGFAVVVPPWETPDAPSHYLYIRHLLLNGRLPLLADQDQGFPYPATLYEWHHPPLYYVTQTLLLKMTGARVTSVSPSFPPLSDSFSFVRASARYTIPRWPWWTESPAYETLLRLRLAGLVLFGMPALLIVGWTGWRLTGLVEFGVALAAAFGFLAQHLFVQVSVENDGMAILWATGVWCILFLTLANPDTLRWYHVTAAGAMTGLGLLSKFTAVPLLAVVLLWGIWCRWRLRMASSLALMLVALAGTLGLYAVLGGEHGAALCEHLTQGRLAVHLDQDPFRFLHLLSDSFWGRFGWMNVSLSPCLSSLLSVGAGAGILRAGWALVQGMWPKEWAKLRSLFWWALGGLVAQLFFLCFVFGPVFQPQGRFLFPALFPFFFLVLLGCFSKANSWKLWGWKGVIALFVILDVVALGRLYGVYWGA